MKQRAVNLSTQTFTASSKTDHEDDSTCAAPPFIACLLCAQPLPPRRTWLLVITPLQAVAFTSTSESYTTLLLGFKAEGDDGDDGDEAECEPLPALHDFSAVIAAVIAAVLELHCFRSL